MLMTWVRRAMFAYPLAIVASFAMSWRTLGAVPPGWWELAIIATIASTAVAWLVYRLLGEQLWLESVLVALVLMPVHTQALIVNQDRVLGLVIAYRGITFSFIPYWGEFLLTFAVGALLAGAVLGIAHLMQVRRAG
jgi:hypothetical protein